MTVRHLLVAVLVVPLVVGTSHAQQRPPAAPPAFPALDGFVYWPAAQAKAVLGKLATANEHGVATALERLGDSGSLRVFLERRAAGDFAPESHAAVDDLLYIQGGEARLLYGGRIEGGEDRGNGEVRGGRIVDGKSQAIAAGDFFFLPAGMPHQIMVASGKHCDLLAIKAPSAKAAAR